MFVDKMMEGQKTVEIRTRRVRLENDSKMWIYTTLPRGSVQMVASIKTVDIGSPEYIWESHKSHIGMPKDHFDAYVNGSEQVSAIVTKEICKLPFDISLNRIKKIVPDFHPPQFLKYLSKNDPFILAIMDILTDESGV